MVMMVLLAVVLIVVLEKENKQGEAKNKDTIKGNGEEM